MSEKYLRLFYLLPVLFLAVACHRTDADPQVAPGKVHVSIDRFEQELFAADPVKTDSLITILQGRYGSFFDLFARRIISIGSPGSPDFVNSLKAFITHHDHYSVYRRVRQVFPDLAPVEEKLNGAFRHYLHYFPDQQVPRVVSFISGFNYSVVSDSGLLGIGLDKYLGTEEEFYSRAGIYRYLRMNMHPGKIPSDCMRLWAETEFPYNDSVNNLLTHMIYGGKIMVFVKAMFPGEPDSLLWGFTGQQMKFCETHEKQMWTYLVEYKMLFKTDRFTIDKMTREGPFTTEFSVNSPARAAVWIGYRITERYMKRNRNLSLKDLMEERDYQKILTLSGYNP